MKLITYYAYFQDAKQDSRPRKVTQFTTYSNIRNLQTLVANSHFNTRKLSATSGDFKFVICTYHLISTYILSQRASPNFTWLINGYTFSK